MIAQPVVQIFFNPICGHFAPRRLAALIAAFEAEQAQTLVTSVIASRIALDPLATHVCIVGGDGTVREIAGFLAQSASQLPVAIFPLGTVNLLAREGHVETSARGCAHALLFGERLRPHYPVVMSGGRFFACASAGPDSAAVARLSPALKRRIGRMAYLVSFARVLWSWPRPRIQLSANGKTRTCEAIYIAKGRYFAGSWSFAPKARVSDRLLHVVALETARRRDFLRFAVTMLLRRDPAKAKGTIAFTCQALQIRCEGPGPIPVQADGDIVTQLPVDLSIGDQPVHFR